MITSNQVNQEYICAKVFLYKYTPPFEVTGNEVVSPLSTFTPYSVPLDDTKYFTKYDISRFLVSYSFEQSIDQTTYSWSVEFQDLALSFGTVDSTLKVVSPPGGNTAGLSFSTDTDSFRRLAVYEANANNIAYNKTLESPILNAKELRGRAPSPLTVQNPNLGTVLSTTPGIRLSDLIQSYDFVSLFLYKSTTPLTDVSGVFSVDNSYPNNPLWLFEPIVQTNNFFTQNDPVLEFLSPDSPHLQYESVLMTTMPNGQTLFSNEFNGYVMRKSVTSGINQVDRVLVSGNGWSRMFGATRRLVKSSLYVDSLYQQGQALGLGETSATQGVYAGRSISYIIRDLFDLVYRIDFNTTFSTIVSVTPEVSINTVSPNNSFSEQIQNPSIVANPNTTTSFFQSPLGLTGSTGISTTFQRYPSLKLQDSFFNITSLLVGNFQHSNLFNLPQYLLSAVMKRRPFSYIEPQSLPPTPQYLVSAVVAAETLNNGIQVPPETFQQAMQNNVPNQVKNYNLNNPVFFDPSVQNLNAYFSFLADVFNSFSPDLQTPFEILDEIRNISFVEIFEQGSGKFIIRAPAYNNTDISVEGRPDIGMIRSSNLNIVTSNYANSVENLVTKIFLGYSANFLPSIQPLEQFAYCDGKLLAQFGLLENSTSANPNVNLDASTDNLNNMGKTTGIFGYAQYLMEILNARLNVGSISCDLDSSVQVGKTYLDESKYKFGYIVGVSKKLVVGGTATMTLSLSYVRDASPEYASPNNSALVSLNVDILPVLTDIENSFAGS